MEIKIFGGQILKNIVRINYFTPYIKHHFSMDSLWNCFWYISSSFFHKPLWNAVCDFFHCQHISVLTTTFGVMESTCVDRAGWDLSVSIVSHLFLGCLWLPHHQFLFIVNLSSRNKFGGTNFEKSAVLCYSGTFSVPWTQSLSRFSCYGQWAG